MINKTTKLTNFLMAGALAFVLALGLCSLTAVRTAPVRAEETEAEELHLVRLDFNDIFTLRVFEQDWDNPVVADIISGAPLEGCFQFTFQEKHFGFFLNYDFYFPFASYPVTASHISVSGPFGSGIYTRQEISCTLSPIYFVLTSYEVSLLDLYLTTPHSNSLAEGSMYNLCLPTGGFGSITASPDFLFECTVLGSYSSIDEIPEFPSVPLPPDPELEHHNFAGWYFDEELTQPYDGSAIYGETELYAKFTLKTYYINFSTGTGATVTGVPVTALSEYAGELPEPPGRVGYAFTGWYTDSERTIKYASVLSMTGNITLYAGWEIKTFTVTFYVSGAVYATVEVPYGATLHEVVSSIQTNMKIIAAVYSDANMHNALNVNSVITGDLNVYAEVGAGLETPGFFGRAGNWFVASWIWLVAGIGLVGAGVISCFIVYKKRGTV